MKKTTTKERVHKAINAFFETDDAYLQETNGLIPVTNTVLLKNDETNPFTEKASSITKLLRQIFLLLPGIFILYFGIFAMVFFYPLHGLSWQMLFWIAAGSFMTWVGSGSLKETKKLLVPLLIATIAVVFSVVFSLFPESFKPDLYFYYSIYLFPLVLIAVHLANNKLCERENISDSL